MQKLFDYEPLPALAAGKEMNSTQRRAIEHGAGPLLVIAGAGTGKTRVITERIRHLLERDSSLLGENILGLTFTKKAAGEMLRRVRKTCGERADGITLTTFHAFCETILKLGAPGRMPLETVDHWILLRRNLRRLQLEKYRVIATDLLDERLRIARSFGATAILRADDPDLVSKLRRTMGKRGLDGAVICAPVDEAVRQAQEAVNGAGKVLLFAHTRRGAETALDLSKVCVDEKDLIGSYSSDFTLQREVAKLVFTRKIDVERLITHKFPLEQTAAAVELAAHPTRDSLKVVVEQVRDRSGILRKTSKR